MKLALLSVCTEPAAECDDSTLLVLLALLVVLRTEPPPNLTPSTLFCVDSCNDSICPVVTTSRVVQQRSVQETLGVLDFVYIHWTITLRARLKTVGADEW